MTWNFKDVKTNICEYCGKKINKLKEKNIHVNIALGKKHYFCSTECKVKWSLEQVKCEQNNHDPIVINIYCYFCGTKNLLKEMSADMVNYFHCNNCGKRVFYIKKGD